MRIIDYKYEIIIGLCVIFFFIIIIFRKQIFGWLNGRPELQSVRKIKQVTLKGKNKKENMCRQIFEDIFERSFPSVRPNFLKNPATGKNLELDGYNEELRLAFEYNGIQHYHLSPIYHKTISDLYSQQQRDRLKRELCAKQNPKISLITIPYTISEKKLRSYILQELRQLN